MPRKPLALLASTHPGPSIVVTVVEVGLGIAVGLEAWRVILLGVAMLAGQFSVGLSNDWLDAERDRAVGRTDKPITRGWISVGAVRWAAWICLGVSIVAAVPLGWRALLTLVFITGTAWGYNLGLKKSALSIVPYVLSFGSLPAFATLSLTTPAAPAAWSIAVGGLLGAAAHFANTLPDLEDDRSTGVNGLPHRLGRRASAILTYVLLLGAAVLEVVGAGGFAFVPADIGLGASIAIAAAGISMARLRTRWHFRFILLAAVIAVAVLLFAGSRLIA